MTSATAYSVNVPAMQQTSQSVLGTVGQTMSVVKEFEQVIVDVMAFMQIGSSVGAANTTMQGHQTSALSSLMSGMDKVGKLIGDVAKAYSDADQTVAQGLGEQQNAQAQPAAAAPAAAATPTDPILATVGTHHFGDTGTDVTALQNQLNAAGYNVGTADGQWGIATQAALAQYAHDHNLQMPAQPNQLDHRVTDAIMQAEGDNPNFTQGGRHEIYGIREGNPGYNALHAAQQQYGVGSAGEQAAAAQIMQNEYNGGHYGEFTDPGEQAAIASAIHMRGTGGGTGVQGTSAILHGMATGQVDAHTAATPQDLQTVHNMTPDQFQQSFRTAREAYDQDAYGNTTTTLNGHRENWWTAYGHGLQSRYDAEEQQFRAMSNGQ